MSDDSDLPVAKRAKIEDGADLQEPQSYGLHVTSQEVDKLREFQVLDELKSDDEDSNDDGSDKTDSSDGLPEEEIEKMLEEDLPEDFKGVPKKKEKKYVRLQKIILEEKGINYFEVLPLDWMMVRHCSGMPIYMHRNSRVCTLSKPYFLGKGNTRRHDIPISAVPCLAYRIALKEEQKQKEIDKKIADEIKNGTWTDPYHLPTKTTIGEKHQVNDDNNDLADDDSQNSDAVSQNGIEKPKCPYIKSLSALKQYGEDSSDSARLGQNDNSQDSDMDVTEIDNTMLGEEINLNYQDSFMPLVEDFQTKSPPVDTTNQLGENNLPLYPGDDNSKFNLDSALAENNQNLPYQLPGGVDSKSHLDSVLPEEKQNLPNQLPGEDDSKSHLDSAAARPVVLPGGIVMPPPRVETVSTSWKSQQLSATELNDYCKQLFKFKRVQIMHFKRWADRRKYTKARKTMQYPTLPEGTKLITIPAQDTGDQNCSGKTAKRDWVMNMNGCSYLSVFHEYVRRALHKQPVYEFKQLENATAPYQATVYIGGMQYGVGRGSSKRQAKSQAARASIHILIPEMRDELPTSPGDLKLSKDDPDFTFFDYVTIEDPRIQEFCGAAAEPSPHAILRTCLLRNFGVGDRHIHTEMKKLEFQKIELTMKVGKHTATVVCKNKKQAKQRASQHILQQLHPHITSWGSLLRLYGSRSMKSCKEKKLEEQQITLLQDKAKHNEPNHAVLEKLRNEMTKLKERDNAVVPIGTLLVSEDLPTHSGSNLNNVDL